MCVTDAFTHIIYSYQHYFTTICDNSNLLLPWVTANAITNKWVAIDDCPGIFRTKHQKLFQLFFPRSHIFLWYLYLLCNNILVLRLLNRNFYFQKNWLLLHRYLKCCFIRYNLLSYAICDECETTFMQKFLKFLK